MTVMAEFRQLLGSTADEERESFRNAFAWDAVARFRSQPWLLERSGTAASEHAMLRSRLVVISSEPAAENPETYESR